MVREGSVYVHQNHCVSIRPKLKILNSGTNSGLFKEPNPFYFSASFFNFSYNFLIYLKKGERGWGSNLLEPSLGYITDIIQSVSNTKFYMFKKTVS